MSTEQMRKAVQDAYAGKKWKQKVLTMHNEQVVAVYFNLLKTKKIK